MKIDKQIQASEKRIAKYEKSVAMYEARVNKKIETLRKKGFDISRDDFPVVKEPKWKYSFECMVSDRAKGLLSYNEWYSISDNAERQYENIAWTDCASWQLIKKLPKTRMTLSINN